MLVQIDPRDYQVALAQAEANLAAATGGETFEVEEMYPAYISVAELQSEKTALIYLRAAMAAEKVHAEIYKKAIEALGKGVVLGGTLPWGLRCLRKPHQACRLGRDSHW
jgi:rubrerythrin